VGATAARRWRAAAGAVLAAALWVGRGADAGVVQQQSPFWFRDDYTDTSSVNLAATTAEVDTAGTGTVTLPYAPVGLSFDPAGTYTLVATRSGVQAFVFDGQAVRPVPAGMWNLGSLSATTGVSWIVSGAAFAVSTTAQVVVYGLVPGAGYSAVQVAQMPFSGALGLAPGPSSLPSAVLVATATGATLLEAQGTSLVAVAGGPSGLAGNLGVAATVDGSLVATWQQEGVQIWAWDGSAYVRAASWDPPTPPLADGPVAGVAFFSQSTGQGGAFWVLTAGGQLLAYAYGPAGLLALPGLSLSVTSSPAAPAALGAGWSADAVGVMYPTGWIYEDLGAGGTFGPDPVRSLGGQTWAVYASSAALQSVALAVGHPVDEVRVEDADCAAGQTPPNCTALPRIPPSTSVAYEVSTDGCVTWSPVPPHTNVPVPRGQSLCYRLILATADPTSSPVVDVTNLYEIYVQLLEPARTKVVLTP
jgi:hypothetical protein